MCGCVGVGVALVVPLYVSDVCVFGADACVCARVYICMCMFLVCSVCACVQLELGATQYQQGCVNSPSCMFALATVIVPRPICMHHESSPPVTTSVVHGVVRCMLRLMWCGENMMVVLRILLMWCSGAEHVN